jgi:CubicO group peptidase (beta-lactamase class C family)
MKRRTFLKAGLSAVFATPLLAAIKQDRLEEAVKILERAGSSGQVAAAVLHIAQRDTSFTRSFGKATDENAMFLLGSISKPISMAALITLYDQGEFQLDDPLQKFIPKFTGEGREHVTLKHLMTHVSGLPDQLPENNELRKKHATLAEFADHAIRTPLTFAPGSQYQYSSMAILLAARVAEQIAGADILTLVDRAVFQPLMMKRSALGLGQFTLEDMVVCQSEGAAPESGGARSRWR